MRENRSDYFPFHPSFDPELAAWLESLESLPRGEATIRRAIAGSGDARRMRQLQLVCEPLSVQSENENDKMIAEQPVFFAMVSEVCVGFCVSLVGAGESDPIFIQIVGVAESARNRGIGTALMRSATKQTPRRIALATQDVNRAARAMNERFAKSIGAEVQRVKIGTYRDRDLGIRRGLGYRPWIIERPHTLEAGTSTTIA